MQPDLFDVGKRDVLGLSHLKTGTATASPVGSGPRSERCGTCRHIARFQHLYGSSYKQWLKCELARTMWTHGKGSDVKARWAACRKWRPADVASDRALQLAYTPREWPADTLTTTGGVLVVADYHEEHGDNRAASRLRALACTDFAETLQIPCEEWPTDALDQAPPESTESPSCGTAPADVGAVPF